MNKKLSLSRLANSRIVIFLMVSLIGALLFTIKLNSESSKYIRYSFGGIDGDEYVNNCIVEDGILTTTTADCYVIYPNIDRYVDTIEVDLENVNLGTGRSEELVLYAYYMTEREAAAVTKDNETGLDILTYPYDQSKGIGIYANEGANYININTNERIAYLRIDLFMGEGIQAEVADVVINPDLTDRIPTVVYSALIIAVVGFLISIWLKGTGYIVFQVVMWITLFVGEAICFKSGSDDITSIFVIFELAVLVLMGLLLRNTERCEGYYIYVLLLFSFAICFLWATITPFNDGPDEKMRYDVVQFITRYGSIPRGDDPRIIDPDWGFSYAFLPILPYMIGSFFQQMVRVVSDNARTLLMAARMVSVLSYVSTVGITYLISRELFKNRGVRLFMPTMLAAFPEFIFLGTYVNNDSFAIMTTALIVLFWIKGIKSGWKWKHCIGLAVGIGLCALSYYNCYGFILLSIFIFFITIIRYGRDRVYIAKTTGAIVGLVFAICGWWFIRNLLIYDGDLLGRAALTQCQLENAKVALNPAFTESLRTQGVPITEMLFGMNWVKTSVKTFIGGFSRLSLFMREEEYAVYMTIYALTMILMVVSVVRTVIDDIKGRKIKFYRMVFDIMMFLAILISVFLSVYYSYTSDFQAQGRYLMPSIVPFTYFVSIGIREIGSMVNRYRSKESRFMTELPAYLFSILALMMALITFIDIVYPYYM